VTGLGLARTPDPRGNEPDLADFEWRLVDVRDREAVDRVVRTVQPELVFHLAAQPLVRPSYHDPVETFATNVMGTVHVLDAARRTASVRAVVSVTSDKCYENRECDWAYREDDPMGGHDPYSASKGCAELATNAFRRSYAATPGSLQIASVRAGNVIGGGDWAVERLVPDFVRSIIANKPLELRRPAAIRPWQHVLEALSGYLLLGAQLCEANGHYAGAWNFGPSSSETICVAELARRLVRYWGRGEVIEAEVEAGPAEARCLKLDSSKARAKLPWEALLSMDERVAWTVDWYRQWHETPDHCGTAMDAQIECYETRCLAWLDQQQRLLRASPASWARPLRVA
jgi:CDP-glucose 4,6-dehydratase